MTQTVMAMHEAWTHDHWTEEELAKLPQDGSRYEIIDGRLYVTRPAGESHQGPAGGLYAMLRFAAPKGWRVLYEIGLRVGRQRVVPDITVLPPDTPTADHDYNDVEVVQPALVIEVASKSTEAIDRGTKMVIYADAGIPGYWRVTRDGIVYMHRLMEKGEYGLTATVRPGQEHEVLWPFPMTLDPARLRS